MVAAYQLDKRSRLMSVKEAAGSPAASQEIVLPVVDPGAVKTMSSREIAQLIEKQHSNIKISAERLSASGVIGTLATQEFTHNGNIYTEYLSSKRDSLILVAQNCPEFTARIVDRWQELEAQVARQPSTSHGQSLSLSQMFAMFSEQASKIAQQL